MGFVPDQGEKLWWSEGLAVGLQEQVAPATGNRKRSRDVDGVRNRGGWACKGV